eukprot:jgi/Chlat1/4890/Chrsp31S04902
MAKYGEGDSRWIVEDRTDGANVHGWHWAERDCLEWSRQRLTELLGSLTMLQARHNLIGGEGACWAQTKGIDKVDGEAYLNQRKGKIIPGYELHVTVPWQGQLKDGSGNVVASVNGQIHLPYIADENADEDPEVKVSVDGNSPAHERLREAVLNKGKAMIITGVDKFRKELAAGGPALSGEAEAAEKKSKERAAEKAKLEAVTAAERQRKAAASGKFTITMTEKFYARPHDIFEALMDEKLVMKYTQSKATISREVGGTFSMFDGALTGMNIAISPDKHISQKWRFNNWPEDVYSTVDIILSEPEHGTTIAKLIQTDVPGQDRFGNESVVEVTERGWRDNIWRRLRMVLGYGV